MNKIFKLISLGLLTTIALSTTDANADCIGSGFGVGVTLSATQQKITFNDKNIKSAHEKARSGMKDKLKAAIAATQSKFNTPNTKDTKVVLDGGEYPVDVYYNNAANGGDGSKIIDKNNADLTDGTKLSDKKDTIKLKTTKFDSENPTRYRILAINEKDPEQYKYNDNGLVDTANGKYLEKQPIIMYPQLLKNNDTEVNKPSQFNGQTDTKDTGNYFEMKQPVSNQASTKTYYIVPRAADLLTEQDLDDEEFKKGTDFPTHAKLNEIFTNNANDKITSAFVASILNDSNLKSEYRSQFKGDEWFEYKNAAYIDTVKHPDLGITSDIIDSVAGGGSDSSNKNNKSSSNTFKDVSKWSFDLGFNVFYQHRIFDWFIRLGLFGNFPIANRTISLVNDSKNSDSKDKKSSNNDLSLTHSFDIGAQILFGYNVTQTFALVFGGEIGYSKYTLNNLNQLSSGYSMNNDKLVNLLAVGSSKEEVLKEYNNTLKNYGLSDKDKSFNKWFWRFIAGCEFNFGKCIVGLHGFFGPNVNLMNSKNNKDFGDLKVVNGGVRASIAFKF